MLLAIKEKDRVVVAFSGRDGYSGLHPDDYVEADNICLWALKKHPHALVGAPCQWPGLDLIRYENWVFDGEMTYDGIITDVVPRMQYALSKRNLLDKNGDMYCAMLIACNDKLFFINESFAVVEMDDCAVFFAESAQDEFALGILDASEGSAEDKIRTVFNALESNFSESCYPAVIMDTKTRRKKILKRG